MPGRGRVERGGDTGEGRIADTQRHQHVQQGGPVMVPADHGGQVAGWIEAAPLRRAHVAQHGGALPHVHQLQRVHVPARHHRVEHKPAHLARMGQREPLRDVGAVRDPVHGEPGDAERRPQRLDVGDRSRGGVGPPVRPDGRRARADRGGCGHRQVRCAHLPLQRRAVQRPRPGAALVQHHQPVAAQRCSKTVYEPRDERHSRLARTAGQEEEHAARGRGDIGHGDPQRQPPRHRAERIQPHAQRPAAEPRDSRARPYVLQPSETLRRPCCLRRARRLRGRCPGAARHQPGHDRRRGQPAKYRYAHISSVGPRHHILVTANPSPKSINVSLYWIFRVVREIQGLARADPAHHWLLMPHRSRSGAERCHSLRRVAQRAHS